MNTAEEKIKLTGFSHGSGCGCKIEPAVLEQILNRGEKSRAFTSLIAGYETKDDAAVWDMENGNYLLSTTDFFTPIVDDAYDFGRIAATNALSDIYAMGGKPAFALAILGFPVSKLPVELASVILDGAKMVCAEAGIPVAGGHSIDIPEPVFGLVVNGFVKSGNLKRNNTAKAGDLLYLTKPLGTGIMASALKRGKISQQDLDSAVHVMCRRNDIGIKLGAVKGVHAMTDVTGFGFLGHLIEMCEGSGLSAHINFPSIPLMEGASRYSDQFIFPDNTYRNWNACEKKVSGVNGPSFIPLCDPQTSGGLLISVSESSKNEIEKLLKENHLGDFAKPVGYLAAPGDFTVSITE